MTQAWAQTSVEAAPQAVGAASPPDRGKGATSPLAAR